MERSHEEQLEDARRRIAEHYFTDGYAAALDTVRDVDRQHGTPRALEVLANMLRAPREQAKQAFDALWPR